MESAPPMQFRLAAFAALAVLLATPCRAAADAHTDYKICVTMPLREGGDAVFRALENTCGAALTGADVTGDKRGRAHGRRALARLHRGAFKSAMDDYYRAFLQSPVTAAMLYGRGLAKLGLGDEDGAKEDVMRARRRKADVAAEFDAIGLTPFWPFDGPNPADGW